MAEGEREARWGGLCRGDSTPRETALENMRPIMVRNTELLHSAKGTPSRPSEGLPGAGSLDGLNELPAPLLMLPKMCPFPDGREKRESVWKSVQELGVRIPGPLGHGPSRFAPEKRFFRRGVKTHRCMLDLQTLLLLWVVWITVH